MTKISNLTLETLVSNSNNSNKQNRFKMPFDLLVDNGGRFGVAFLNVDISVDNLYQPKSLNVQCTHAQANIAVRYDRNL